MNDIFEIPYILQKKYIENHTQELNEMMQFVSKHEVLEEVQELKLQQEKLLLVYEEQNAVKLNVPQWYNVSTVADAKGLSADAVRKQLENGEFEDGVDFKKPKGKILIHQGAVERIQRKRRNSNAYVL